ncbi:MAG: STAS domain-containing protein [Marinobacterium sp.]
MMAVKVEQPAPDRICLSGDLVFATVLEARRELLKRLAQCEGVCQVDWSGVQRVDSSALSLWLSCLRFAAERQQTLTLVNPPEDFASIAGLVGLAEALA